MGKLTLDRIAVWGTIAVAVVLVWMLTRIADPVALGSWIGAWYGLLNQVYLNVGVPLNELVRPLQIPLVTALVLGIVGALSPCQLSTGAAALAYLAPLSHDRGKLSAGLAAYTAGKVLIYTLLGGAVLFAGFQANDSIPVIQTVRKVLGPLMLFLGLYFLGVIRFQFAPGQRLSSWLEDRVAGSGSRGAFSLGVAFSLAFCPTLFLLFFGLLLPLAISQPFGALYPALFALGTVAPLMLLAASLSSGVGAVGAAVRRVGKTDRGIRWAAAAVLLLAGLNDTVVYWLV